MIKRESKEEGGKERNCLVTRDEITQTGGKDVLKGSNPQGTH